MCNHVTFDWRVMKLTRNSVADIIASAFVFMSFALKLQECFSGKIFPCDQAQLTHSGSERSCGSHAEDGNKYVHFTHGPFI